MRFDFIKCHGSGNDFPLIDARDIVLSDARWSIVARVLADRNGPVGGDGLIALTRGDQAHAFGFRMWNADGSEAETCLNGLRCAARMGFAALGIERARVRLKTSSVEVARDAPLAPGVHTVAETAGPAGLDVTAWPLTGKGARIIEQPIPTLPVARRFTAVAMPNPHLIAFVERVDEAELVAVGEACEAAPAWLPNRANVSYVEVRDATTLFVRTYERGVGLTDSCGSAMAASSFAACLTGRTSFDTPLTVLNKGGLVRALAKRDAMVRLSGNATWEWEGSIEVDQDKRVANELTITSHHAGEAAAWARLAESAG